MVLESLSQARRNRSMNPTDGVIQEALNLYRTHFVRLFSIAFIIYAGIAILSAIAAAIGTTFALVVAIPLSILGLFLVQAALVEAVADIRDGRVDMSIGETFSRGATRILPVAAVALLVAAILLAMSLLLAILPGGLSVAAGVLFFIAILVLLTWWSLTVPIIVLEKRGTIDSVTRSRKLVQNHDLQVFGVIVLMILVLFLVGVLLALILSPFPRGLNSFLSNILGGSLTAPFWALVITLLYFRLKEAKEGLGGTPPTQIS